MKCVDIIIATGLLFLDKEVWRLYPWPSTSTSMLPEYLNLIRLLFPVLPRLPTVRTHLTTNDIRAETDLEQIEKTV